LLRRRVKRDRQTRDTKEEMDRRRNKKFSLAKAV
jgi:hypothetical protein